MYSSGGAAIASVFQSLISLACSVLTIIGMWKVFEKAGKPGWAALIPFYNMYILFEIVYNDGIKFLFLLIPFYNIYVAIKLYINLAEVFGKEKAFGVGLCFISPVFMPLLGFGNDQYKGPMQQA